LAVPNRYHEQPLVVGPRHHRRRFSIPTQRKDRALHPRVRMMTMARRDRYTTVSSMVGQTFKPTTSLGG
jgi:hypothetical protein